MMLPHSHGRVGADLHTDALEFFETLAEADASVSWTVMIGGGASMDIAGLPRASFGARFFARGPNIVVRGNRRPRWLDQSRRRRGPGRPARSGFFVERARACDLALRQCRRGDGRQCAPGSGWQSCRPTRSRSTTPRRCWACAGPEATTSASPTSQSYPPSRPCVHWSNEPCLDEPVVRVPLPALLALSIAGVAVGIGAGALADAVASAQQRVPLLAPAPACTDPRCSRPTWRRPTPASGRLARCCTVGRGGVGEPSRMAGEPFSLRRRAQARAAAVWATPERAVTMIEAAYHSSGTGPRILPELGLPRRLRNVTP